MSTDTTTQEHVRLRGIDFAYTDQGTGTVVLNAHGLTQSHRAALALGFRTTHRSPTAGRD